MAAALPPPPLSDAQLLQLYRDGFTVVPALLPPAAVGAARRAVFEGIGRAHNSALGRRDDPERRVRNSTRGEGLEGGEEALDAATRSWGGLGTSAVITDLFNATPARACVEQLFGGAPRPAAFGQVAVNFPSGEPTDYVGQPGFPDSAVPFYGANLHVDGCWNGGSSPLQGQSADVDSAALAKWYSPVGTNNQKMEPRPGIANLTNFTLLVGVPLSDQSADG
jgi:hypothetical protein